MMDTASQRAVIHVDMDAFFASVEVRERPELRGRPVIVGGRPEGRGVVAAASYEARRFGIHSAMPTATALRLCPQAVVLPPRHELYAGVSARIHEVFARYTPLIEPLSLDEAFLDVTASVRLFGTPEAIGRRIKQEVREAVALVASVGVAPNKFLAKLASDLDKPDGFLVVSQDGAGELLAPLPVTRLWAVGKSTAERLERLGIRTIGQLRAYPRRLLVEHFGKAGAQFWELARGDDRRPVVPEHEAQSVSHETTFARDIDQPPVLRGWIRELAEQVAWRLRRAGLEGRSVFIKVRFADFTTITRSRSLPRPTNLTAPIQRAAEALYAERVPAPHPPVRLVGVGVSGFDGGPAQGDLFAPAAGEGKLDRLLDEARERFGAGVLRRGKAPPAGEIK